jgi:hypothetical protein
MVFVMAKRAIVNSEPLIERGGERRPRFARSPARRVALRTSTSPRTPGNRESLADSSEPARAIVATFRGGIANRAGRT